MATDVMVRRFTQPNNAWNIILWMLQAIGAAVFIPAGVQKLAGDAGAVQLFETIGWGQWLRYVVGLIEIVGGALLLFPNFAAIGSLLMGVMMATALLLHIFIIGGSPLASVLLLVAMAVVAYGRREQYMQGSTPKRPKTHTPIF